MEEKLVWIVIATCSLDVYDSFNIALERYNQLKEQGVEAEIHKRPVRSKLAEVKE